MSGHMSTNGGYSLRIVEKNKKKEEEEEAVEEASSILSVCSSDKYLIKASNFKAQGWEKTKCKAKFAGLGW